MFWMLLLMIYWEERFDEIMKNAYKIDFVSNTLSMSKAFEKAAGDPSSEEYKLLQKIRADFPNLRLVHQVRRPPRKCNPNKNMTYANMEKYMGVFSNADVLLAQFEKVKAQSATASSPYQFVKEWFETQFPNYREMPDFTTSPKLIDLALIKRG